MLKVLKFDQNIHGCLLLSVELVRILKDKTPNIPWIDDFKINIFNNLIVTFSRININFLERNLNLKV